MNNIGIWISIIGIIIGVITSVIIYYRQKESKKQKVKKEITDIIRRGIQTKEGISASYIGSIVGTKCRENKIKKIEITEIVEDLIFEYSAIKNKNTQQIIEKLIAIRREMAILYKQVNNNIDIAEPILMETTVNLGVMKTEREYIAIAEKLLKSSNFPNLEKMVEKSTAENKEPVKTNDRFNTICILYDKYISTNPKLKKSVYLNKDLLYIAVGCYFDDIEKFKQYSNSKYADNHKQAAYIIKWLSKIRPIQILPNREATNDLFLINSIFAIFMGLVFLLTLTPNDISPATYNYLIYATMYRDISELDLAALLHTLENNAIKNQAEETETI